MGSNTNKRNEAAQARREPDANQPHVVLVGTAVTGFRVIGPFRDKADGASWAKNSSHAMWCAAPLENPVESVG